MAKWRNKTVGVKGLLLNEEGSDKNVIATIDRLVPQLQRICNAEKSFGKIDEYLLEEFQNNINDFIWVKESIEKDEDPTECGFETWCDAFNEYLVLLYDLADTTITKHDGFNDEKFLWVE